MALQVAALTQLPPHIVSNSHRIQVRIGLTSRRTAFSRPLRCLLRKACSHLVDCLMPLPKLLSYVTPAFSKDHCSTVHHSCKQSIHSPFSTAFFNPPWLPIQGGALQAGRPVHRPRR